ncbi:hypothetical protein Syn7803C16_101 [Synechococcus phage ACG-2014f]|uniref:Uncharacterized protein n=1 Tax=Synechococcus phage ACG-2014f TaxID=1493511 RepID=A0A0E3G2F6_9CAUD|nr:hypothetical protein Syn7803C16_101 [Synechococcus phage ACG-2014f]
MEFIQTDYPANMAPNVMERNYGRGIILTQVDEDGVIPFSVFNFKKEDWNWGADYYMTEHNFYTLEEAEAVVTQLVAS